MKTSELKKHIKDMGLGCQEGELYIDVENIIRIYIKYDGIHMLHTIINVPELYKLMKLAIEYSETPISEREEEKKYYVRSIINYSKNFDKHYLKFDCSRKEYYFFETNSDSGYAIETKFTEKQISEMPIEIQKAIECGFLKKVEVVE